MTNFRDEKENVLGIMLGCLDQSKHIERLSILNDEQEVFLLELPWAERKRLEFHDRVADQSLFFLSGGANLGKIMLIMCLYQTSISLFKFVLADPEKPTVSPLLLHQQLAVLKEQRFMRCLAYHLSTTVCCPRMIVT